MFTIVSLLTADLTRNSLGSGDSGEPRLKRANEELTRSKDNFSEHNYGPQVARATAGGKERVISENVKLLARVNETDRQ